MSPDETGALDAAESPSLAEQVVPSTTALLVPGAAVAVSLHSKHQTCARGLVVAEPTRDDADLTRISYIPVPYYVPTGTYLSCVGIDSK